MFVLEDKSPEVRMIDFGDGERVLFSLPVLGDAGVPIMVSTSVALIMEAFKGGRPADAQIASLWGTFVDAVGGSYPHAMKHLGAMDIEQLKHVLDHWFSESARLADFSPKAH